MGFLADQTPATTAKPRARNARGSANIVFKVTDSVGRAGDGYLDSPEEARTPREDRSVMDHSPPSHISKIVPPTIHLGPPPLTVDTTIFEMWLGSLSTHRGLAIPVS